MQKPIIQNNNGCFYCSFLFKPSRGFTLVETLAAMMLLAICLVVILQLFSGGLKSGKISEDYTRAVIFAREKMEEYLLPENFHEGIFEGTIDNNYRWKVDIAIVEPENEKEISQVDLLQVDVFVFWGTGEGEKQFQISTLKIAEKKDLDG